VVVALSLESRKPPPSDSNHALNRWRSNWVSLDSTDPVSEEAVGSTALESEDMSKKENPKYIYEGTSKMKN
jgi:hypothetical protein